MKQQVIPLKRATANSRFVNIMTPINTGVKRSEFKPPKIPRVYRKEKSLIEPLVLNPVPNI